MGVVTKRVNIDARFPVRSISPVIHGVKKDTIMTSSDILKCLCRRARVEEILPNGTTVLLNMNNYYTDNGAGLDAEHIVVKEDNHIVPPVHEEHSVDDSIVENTNIENSTTEEVVDETSIEEESYEDVINEVPEAPIEAQVVETKTDDEVKCEVETEETTEDSTAEVETESIVEDGITEVEAEPIAAGVNAENAHKKNNNKKKK